MKRILWFMVSGLMALSLLIAACGPAKVEEKKPAPVVEEKKPAPVVEEKRQEVAVKEAVTPAAEMPKYGGTLNLVGGDVTSFDSYSGARGSSITDLTSQELWMGDWAKGPAGGYDSKETDWGMAMNNLFDLKTGYLAEDVSWTVDEAKDLATIKFKIRRGVHYGLNPKLEASRLVNGREVTADDIVFMLKRTVQSTGAAVWRSNPELRDAQITKTGPWEVTVKETLDALVNALTRLGEGTRLLPPEITQKYGEPITDWKLLVGTGPFILTEYIAGSVAILDRNPNFWMTDPVGPGKGNQLPYLDTVRFLIIPDKSTRFAALRTGKIDQMWEIKDEEAVQMRMTSSHLKEKEEVSYQGRGYGAQIVHDRPPFKDIRVRQALMLATDFKYIVNNYFKGRAQYMTWPYSYIPDYAELYVGLDDPELPQSVKDLYVYNPEKAKQLLKEAGYPSGFKTSIILTTEQVDYYSIIKDMWSKVGIDLALDIKEGAAKTAIENNKTQTALIDRNTAPIAIFLTMASFSGTAPSNASMMNDPYVEEMRPKIQRAALTDMREAMRLHQKVSRHIITQVYAIPKVEGYWYTFWAPWVRNYSGELSIGYDNRETWAQWAWLDQELKKKMGF